MKKIVMIAFVAAATLSFVACNTKTQEAPAANADSLQVEAPAAEPIAQDTTTLGKYAALVDKALPLIEKVQKGDAVAAAEYASISQEIATLAGAIQKEVATMTPEQATKFADLGKKMADAAQQATAKLKK